MLGFSSFSFLASVCIFVSSLQIHLVRINDFGFFFKVESVLMVLNLSVSNPVTVILFVVGEDILWVWVSHESVSAAHHSALLLITGRQILN